MKVEESGERSKNQARKGARSEIDYSKAEKLRGMNVTFVTSARSDSESQLLLKYLGMPFKTASQ